VQETLAAPTADEKGDEVTSRAVVQNLHHAGEIRKAHTGLSVLKKLDLYDSCPVSRRTRLSE
jgi:hypothetical protein